MIDINSLRAATSRANGALSNGPVTPEGKRRSSMNALKHGLYAKSAVLWYESQEEFDQLVQAFLDHYKPATEAEAILIEREAANLWRQTRLDRAEGLVLRDLYEDTFGTLTLINTVHASDEDDEDEEDEDELVDPADYAPSHEEALARTWRSYAGTGFSQYLRRERQEIERAHRRFNEQIADTRTNGGPGFVSQPQSKE